MAGPILMADPVLRDASQIGIEPKKVMTFDIEPSIKPGRETRMVGIALSSFGSLATLHGYYRKHLLDGSIENKPLYLRFWYLQNSDGQPKGPKEEFLCKQMEWSQRGLYYINDFQIGFFSEPNRKSTKPLHYLPPSECDFHMSVNDNSLVTIGKIGSGDTRYYNVGDVHLAFWDLERFEKEREFPLKSHGLNKCCAFESDPNLAVSFQYASPRHLIALWDKRQSKPASVKTLDLNEEDTIDQVSVLYTSSSPCLISNSGSSIAMHSIFQDFGKKIRDMIKPDQGCKYTGGMPSHNIKICSSKDGILWTETQTGKNNVSNVFGKVVSSTYTMSYQRYDCNQDRDEYVPDATLTYPPVITDCSRPMDNVISFAKDKLALAHNREVVIYKV